MKKRLTSLCVCIALLTAIAMGLGACKQKIKITDDMTPTQTVEAFLESFKTQDWEILEQIYAGDSEAFASGYGLTGNKETDDPLQEEFLSKMYDFDYEITGEEISADGNSASVSINTTAYNMVEVFNNFYQDYMGQALDRYTGKSSEMTEEELEEMASEILQEKLDNAKKDYKGEAALTLTKTDGRWIVDEINESNPAFLNAISGGMMDVASDIVNTKEGAGTAKPEDTDNKKDTDD